MRSIRSIASVRLPRWRSNSAELAAAYAASDRAPRAIASSRCSSRDVATVPKVVVGDGDRQVGARAIGDLDQSGRNGAAIDALEQDDGLDRPMHGGEPGATCGQELQDHRLVMRPLGGTDDRLDDVHDAAAVALADIEAGQRRTEPEDLDVIRPEIIEIDDALLEHLAGPRLVDRHQGLPQPGRGTGRSPPVTAGQGPLPDLRVQGVRPGQPARDDGHVGGRLEEGQLVGLLAGQSRRRLQERDGLVA